MTLYFITGNKNKLAEVQAIIPNIQNIKLDLPEIQHSDAKEIIREKLNVAIKQHKDNHNKRFFCEDTSLYLKCLNGFPGPLIKWFLESLGTEGIYNLVNKHNNPKVIAKTIVGYTDGTEIKFFEGELKGNIVKPKGNRFGWDPIFQPESFNKTLAEMSIEEKNKISMRQQAVMKLKDYLNKNPNHPKGWGIFNVSNTPPNEGELMKNNPATASSGVSETNEKQK